MLPLPMRNRLATLIVESFHDADARRGLEALARAWPDPVAPERIADVRQALPRGWFDDRGGATAPWGAHAAELADRAARAWQVVRARPLESPPVPLGAALDAAGRLFDARLYFETHELLEPRWMSAAGSDRDALQGLIQIAVGFQHLANGNAAGARSLLREGSIRLLERELGGRALGPFARAVASCLDDVRRRGATAPSSFDWSTVPSFPVRSG
jgi:Domain of unknown function (DUF309)